MRQYLQTAVREDVRWPHPALAEPRQELETLLAPAADPLAEADPESGKAARDWIKSCLVVLEGNGEAVPASWFRWLGERSSVPAELAPLYRDLHSSDPGHVRAAVAALAERAPDLQERDRLEVIEALSSLFYIDTAERPDLAEAVEDALTTIVQLGASAVPFLVDHMAESDINATLWFARALGGMGSAAIQPLLDVLQHAHDSHVRACALYALTKVRDPGVGRALPLVLPLLTDPSREIREAAARAVGKIVEVTPPGAVTPSHRTALVAALLERISDPAPGVRCRAMRSLGKLVRRRYTAAAEQERIHRAADSVLGLDDAFAWDRAFVVRQEAEEVMRYLADAHD